MKKLWIQFSPLLTGVLIVLAAVGYALGAGIQLKLSLTDLLPENHPAVLKFEKLTEMVGGVGFFTIVLKAPDGKSHLELAPRLAEDLKKSPLVRNVFYDRDQRFFNDRLLYYIDLNKLQELERGIETEITKAKRAVFDLGLWADEKDAPTKPVFDDELKNRARRSASVSPNLVSKDGTHLLLMVKPSFDSMDLAKTKELMAFAQSTLTRDLPSGVSYEFAERYYTKVVETKMIERDIFTLGTISLLLIAFLLYTYVRSVRALLLIFIPVLLGMGITVGLTRLYIGHINIITGFLMGIVSGLGVDYGIHLLLRLRLELKEPSSAEPNPVWRTLASSGHSVFVGAMAAATAFFLLCFSSFRAFSEFGFICGTGITSVLFCLLASFSALAHFFKLDNTQAKEKTRFLPPLPNLSLPRGLIGAVLFSLLLIGFGLNAEFEYDFGKMLQHSKKMEDLSRLVDDIYERSNTPSALFAPNREEALAVEEAIRKRYMPKLVNELISGATIVPSDQAEKQQILKRIEEKIRPLKDRWIEKSLGIPGATVRRWVQAKPFELSDLPTHVQSALRGTRNDGFLIYIFPAVKLTDARGVRAYASMIQEIEKEFPNLLTGSDAVIFSDILDLIDHDGAILLFVIFTTVGLFVWFNVRKPSDTLLSYLPLLLSLPIGMGLMVLCGIKFNIFNIAIIPTFVAMGIDVPIHIVHRARETGSGFKAARDLAPSIHLALLTAAVGFGVLIFSSAGVLRSLGWIALLGTAAVWWVGLIVLPAFLEWHLKKSPLKETPVPSLLIPAEA